MHHFSKIHLDDTYYDVFCYFMLKYILIIKLKANIDFSFLLKYGYWNEKDRLVVTKNFSTTQAEIYKELTGQVLRVATIEV